MAVFSCKTCIMCLIPHLVKTHCVSEESGNLVFPAPKERFRLCADQCRPSRLALFAQVLSDALEYVPRLQWPRRLRIWFAFDVAQDVNKSNASLLSRPYGDCVTYSLEGRRSVWCPSRELGRPLGSRWRHTTGLRVGSFSQARGPLENSEAEPKVLSPAEFPVLQLFSVVENTVVIFSCKTHCNTVVNYKIICYPSGTVNGREGRLPPPSQQLKFAALMNICPAGPKLQFANRKEIVQ